MTNLTADRHLLFLSTEDFTFIVVAAMQAEASVAIDTAETRFVVHIGRRVVAAVAIIVFEQDILVGDTTVEGLVADIGIE